MAITDTPRLETAQIEDAWITAATFTGVELPTDFGDDDRYVFLGIDYYVGLGVACKVARLGITHVTSDEAIAIVRDEIVAQNGEAILSTDHLLRDERWQQAAIATVALVAEMNQEIIHG